MDPEALRRQNIIMLRNARRLHRLINQLLDLAKLEAGSVRLKLRRADLVGFVRTIGSSFSSLSRQRKITLEIRTDRGRLLGDFDPDALDKILYNLLSNAFKFTEPGGRVSVSITRDGREAVLC